MTTTSTISYPKPDTYKSGDNFNRFCDRFQQYVVFTNIKNDNLHLFFLSTLDSPTYDILKSVELTDDEKKAAPAFCKKYSEKLYATDDIRNLTFELMSIKQGNNESIEKFKRKSILKRLLRI